MVDRRPARGPEHAPLRSRSRGLARRRWRTVPALALLITLALLASLSDAVTARPARERSAETTTLRQERHSAAQQRAAARRSARRAREQQPRVLERASQQSHHHKEEPSHKHRHGKGPERYNGIVTSTCTLMTWRFRRFPNMPNNKIIEKVAIGHYAPVPKIERFDGEGTVELTPLSAPPGRDRIDADAKWRGNGLKGGFDIVSKKMCPPNPALTIEKLQRLSGPFTKLPLTGVIGETVEYEIKVRNTGNVPLTLSNFTDPHCDPETLKGGPGAKPLLPGPTPETGEVSIYTCSHKITGTEPYENVATATATPNPGQGSPITSESNTVVVNAPVATFTIEKRQKIEGEYKTSPLTGNVGQTVSYEIIVTNTGNTTLTLSNFSDPHCEGIAGEPTKPLETGQSATYTCHHKLTSADQTVGSYVNEASVIGTPPAGGQISHTSNKVVVTLPPAQTAPVIYVAYADSAANNHGGPSGIPSPWKGSTGVTFVGCGFGGTDNCPTSNGVDIYDAGAVRIEATSSSGAISVTGASVTVGPCKYEPWPGLSATIQPGQSLILTQTGKHRCTSSTSAEQDNFDTSESFLLSPQYQQFKKTGKCSSDGYFPAITLTLNGKTTTANDSGQVLNDQGIDNDICTQTSEASNWVKLAPSSGSAIGHAAPVHRTGNAKRRGRHRSHRHSRTSSVPVIVVTPAGA
jgi:uncharacterized repeat protein (TIGR01451 family)